MSDNYNGLDPTFAEGLRQLIAASGGRIWINSGYRSVERQQQLWDQKLREVGGNVQEARKWVAPPGSSNHNHGLAADLGGDLQLAHQLAARFGLNFRMGHEPWHIEPIDIKSKHPGNPIDGYTIAPDGTPPEDYAANDFGNIGTQIYVLTALLKGTKPEELHQQFALTGTPGENIGGTGENASRYNVLSEGGHMANTGKWAHDFLVAAGIAPNSANVAFVNAWMKAESGNNPGSGTGGGKFNPLNTTQGGFAGETDYNKVGVKNYQSYEDGIRANVHALQNGRYNAIIEAMKGNDPMAMAQALTNSPWGTGPLVTKILSDQSPESWSTPYTPPEAPGEETSSQDNIYRQVGRRVKVI